MSAGHHLRCAIAIAIAITAVAAAPASAQQVRGRVLDSRRQPIIGALVELRSTDNRSLEITLASASGTFVLHPPGAGTYRYRVAAIGFQPLALVTMTVPAEGMVLGDLVLQTQMVRLPDLIAVARGQFCGGSHGANEMFDRLLDGAQTALQVMEAAVSTRQVAFTVARIEGRTLFGGASNYVEADTTIQHLARWPIESIDPDTLRVVGFSRMLHPRDESTREYYGPDARVLFSPWFLASHCFRLDKPDRKHPSDSLHLHFTPAHHTKLVDIAGEMVLDAHSLALLQLSFNHLNLPGWMDADQAGGTMEFAPDSSGLWITTRWSLWAPRGTIGVDGRFRVAGDAELNGWVLQILHPDSAAHPPAKH